MRLLIIHKKKGSVKDSVGDCGFKLQYNGHQLTEIFAKSSRPEASARSPDNYVEFAIG